MANPFSGLFPPFPTQSSSSPSQSSSSSSSSSSAPTSSSTSSSASSSSSSSSSTPQPTTTSSSSSQPSSSSSSTQSSTISHSSSSLSSSQSSSSSASSSSQSSLTPSSASSSLPVTTSSFSHTSSVTSSSGGSSFSLQTTTSGGQVVVVTTFVGGSPTGSASTDTTTSSKGFFQNKGAVAGVFTVVGLVVAAIVVALLTNAIRRRRAKKFDRDVAEAAAEAAAQAHAPDFTDDDYGYPDDHMQEFGDRGGYSDTASHGTYAQPPMQPGESYNMSELPPFDPYGPAGAAGIGAAGINRARSMGNANQTTPYNAFARPPSVTMQDPFNTPVPLGGYGTEAQGQDLHRGPSMSLGGTSIELPEAAGLPGVGGAPPGLVRGASQRASSDQQVEAGLGRSKSLGATTLGGSSSLSEYSSSVTHHHPGFGGYGATGATMQGYSQPPISEEEDPYGGYTAPSSNPHRQSVTMATLPNPFDTVTQGPNARPTSGNFSSPDSSQEGALQEAEPSASAPWHSQDESRMSLRDSEDYGYGGGRRVLKVANE
ncbi:hypothetical protein AcV5_005517 [Taiwanofungus camphoratus]|nr:hypothetical protein AcV5_005517 [Antrodia cinnamomea]KAI0948867.1 hypothetical protein AcV7_009496 [Antrodia cinnamomea]